MIRTKKSFSGSMALSITARAAQYSRFFFLPEKMTCMDVGNTIPPLVLDGPVFASLFLGPLNNGALMNIYERLRSEHQKQKDLAAEIMDTSGDTRERQRLFAEFYAEAEAHAAAEEQTFYAALIEKPEGQPKARHSVHEHKKAADLLCELKELDMGSGGWIRKFEKLKEELEHHIREEENEVFSRAKQLLDSATAEQLATDFDRRKKAELENMETAA